MTEGARVRRRQLVWRTSRDICGLADGERHLGHILNTGNHWTAFDATHMNDDRTGFRLLGSFTSLAAAKQAVEQAILREPVEIRSNVLRLGL